MKRLLRILLVVSAVVVLAAGALLLPPVQTAIVRRVVSGVEGAEIAVGRVAAGLGGATVEDLTVKTTGADVVLRRARVEAGLIGLVFGEVWHIRSVVVEGLEVRMKPAPEAPEPERSPEEPRGPLKEHRGVLASLSPPKPVRVDRLAVEAVVEVPGGAGAAPRRLVVAVDGGGIAPGAAGEVKVRLEESAAPSGEGAVSIGRLEGTARVVQAENGLLEGLSVEFSAPVATPVAFTLAAAILQEGAGERATVRLSPVAETAGGGLAADFRLGEGGAIDGAVEITDLAPALAAPFLPPGVEVGGSGVLAGEVAVSSSAEGVKFEARRPLRSSGLRVVLPGLPEVDDVSFEIEPSGTVVPISGRLEVVLTGRFGARVQSLERVDPRLASVGAVSVQARWDVGVSGAGGLFDVSARKATASVLDARGATLAAIELARPLSLRLPTGEILGPAVEGRVATLALAGVPLTWAAPWVPEPLGITGGTVSGGFELSAAPGGWVVEGKPALRVANAGVALGGRPLLGDADVVVRSKVTADPVKRVAVVAPVRVELVRAGNRPHALIETLVPVSVDLERPRLPEFDPGTVVARARLDRFLTGPVVEALVPRVTADAGEIGGVLEVAAAERGWDVSTPEPFASAVALRARWEGLPWLDDVSLGAGLRASVRGAAWSVALDPLRVTTAAGEVTAKATAAPGPGGALGGRLEVGSRTRVRSAAFSLEGTVAPGGAGGGRFDVTVKGPVLDVDALASVAETLMPPKPVQKEVAKPGPPPVEPERGPDAEPPWAGWTGRLVLEVPEAWWRGSKATAVNGSVEVSDGAVRWKVPGMTYDGGAASTEGVLTFTSGPVPYAVEATALARGFDPAKVLPPSPPGQPPLLTARVDLDVAVKGTSVNLAGLADGSTVTLRMEGRNGRTRLLAATGAWVDRIARLTRGAAPLAGIVGGLVGGATGQRVTDAAAVAAAAGELADLLANTPFDRLQVDAVSQGLAQVQISALRMESPLLVLEAAGAGRIPPGGGWRQLAYQLEVAKFGARGTLGDLVRRLAAVRPGEPGDPWVYLAEPVALSGDLSQTNTEALYGLLFRGAARLLGR